MSEKDYVRVFGAALVAALLAVTMFSLGYAIGRDVGQPERTPAEVIEERWIECLDKYTYNICANSYLGEGS